MKNKTKKEPVVVKETRWEIKDRIYRLLGKRKPVTEKMISTGNDIPTVVNDNIYYDRTNMGVTNTQGLRDFHNLFVKRKIITSVSKRGDTLIDMSVGMGGDLQKWIDAKLSFVFGLDYSKDNIHNRIRGVCSRYLNSKKK